MNEFKRPKNVVEFNDGTIVNLDSISVIGAASLERDKYYPRTFFTLTTTAGKSIEITDWIGQEVWGKTEYSRNDVQTKDGVFKLVKTRWLSKNNEWIEEKDIEDKDIKPVFDLQQKINKMIEQWEK